MKRVFQEVYYIIKRVYREQHVTDLLNIINT